MSLSTSLHLRQQQKLVMTPMLQQALKILQMNSLELSDLIKEEISENPILEEMEGDAEAAPPEEGEGEPAEAGDADASEAPAEAPAAVESAEVAEAPEAKESQDAVDAPKDESWEDYFDDNGTDYAGMAEKGKEEKEGFESFLSARPNLQEHLLAQLDALELDPEMHALCEGIIGAVNERGYYTGEAPEGKAFQALRLLQKMDPIGVGARNLRECLLLQLESRELKGSLAWDIVSGHLENLERRRFEIIQKALKIGPAEMKEAEELISTLEPFPGRPFGGEPNPAVTVDAFVEKDPQGKWVVMVNDRHFPRLGFNQYYRKLMKQGGSDNDEAKAWLKNKYESALWLIRGIESRQKTLRRVTEEIVAVQEGFLEHGPSAFQPLTLKDIALKTGLHESTVSRVTSSKYVETPRGVFELKFFFSSGLKTDSGGDASSLSVKESIKDLLEEEEHSKPLSDQQIAERLSGQGIQIARRTVAKYREELGVLPAHRRKEGR
jgi:RNA polymerase sigma-54 factor